MNGAGAWSIVLLAGHKPSAQRKALPKATFFLFLAQQSPPPVGQGLLIHEVSRSHTTTHHSQ